MPGLVPVTFVAGSLATQWAGVEAIQTVDAVAPRIRSGVDAWIIQSYLELRGEHPELGLDIRISAAFPAGQCAVAHRDDLRWSARYDRSFVAYARADRGPVYPAAYQIVQNPDQLAGELRSVFIPHWPQPGLIARDPSRVGVTTAGFYGRLGSVPGFFSDPAFLAALAHLGVSLRTFEREWGDYGSTDVAVALRYDPPIGAVNKPASKLVNAWLAGVPAILGPEPAYRNLRRSELDYLEVRDGRELVAALARLKGDSGLYHAMVENGRKRAVEFDRPAVRARWLAFLSSEFVPAYRREWAGWPGAPLARAARTLRFGRQLWRQRRERDRYKALERAQAEAIARAGLGARFE